MTHRSKHLRKLKLHGLTHNHHHFKLKHLVEHFIEEEKRYWPMILGLFLIIAGVLTWSYKTDIFPANDLYPAAPAFYTQGYQQGLLTSQKLGQGSGVNEGEEIQDQSSPPSAQGLANSLVIATHLSKGEAEGKVETNLLQKSLLTSFYLGETTNVFEAALENDTQLLNEIENVLKVELFQYLNQSVNRADTLQNYLNLMIILEDRARIRQNEITTTLNFLEQSIQAQEQVINTYEENFFTQLEARKGEEAQEQLNEFIALQQKQAENKAKAGAYESLKGYYTYYQPILQNRIEAVTANRDALIAGVNVVNLPGIEELDLIVEEEE